MSEVIIQVGAFARAAQLMGRPRRVAVITDDNVAAHYLGPMMRALKGAGHEAVSLSLAPGENSKSLDSYGRILGFLADSGLTRTDTVLALGGGMVGDVAGFAAATYQRGVDLVQVPTSLLACVDSSVGDKTAIDLPQGKNLAGAFWPARLTLIDPLLLRTLPYDHYRDGLAEVVKYAAIRDRALFDLLPYEEVEEEGIIRCCVDIKRAIVARDAHDHGERQLLNFGHTVGHALERLSGYELSHGQGVAVGMAVMARASERLGLCAPGEAGLLIGMMHTLSLPTDCPYGPREIFDAMQADKKRGGQHITLVMMHALGDCRLHPMPMQEALAVVEAGCAP